MHELITQLPCPSKQLHLNVVVKALSEAIAGPETIAMIHLHLSHMSRQLVVGLPQSGLHLLELLTQPQEGNTLTEFQCIYI